MRTVQIVCAALLVAACSYEKGNSDIGVKANERYDQEKAPETASPTAESSRTGNVGTPDVLPVRGVTDPAGTASTQPPATDTTPTEAPGTAEEAAPATKPATTPR